MNTKQQEFDAVVKHLFAQGRPAKDSSNPAGPGCYYRQPDSTNKCAVGCRIPDDVYVPEMDKSNGDNGTGLYALILNFGKVLPPEIVEYRDMFEELQIVHDRADDEFDKDDLAMRLAKVAINHGVEFTRPEA